MVYDIVLTSNCDLVAGVLVAGVLVAGRCSGSVVPDPKAPCSAGGVQFTHPCIDRLNQATNQGFFEGPYLRSNIALR